MPTSLVTGAAGFIGSHVAKSLLEKGHEVVALDDLSGGFSDNVPPDSEFVEGSVVDADLIAGLFGGAPIRSCLPSRRLCRRRSIALHQAFQLSEQRPGEREPDQRIGET